ncbi:MAG: hypothetical protein QOE98_2598 [Gaiellaceae bacterium]|nr:hypothetical protein [Gaiellaceae bacterium]
MENFEYRSGDDVTLEFVGLVFHFSQRDFRERVIGAARLLRLTGEVTAPAGDDLVALAAHGALAGPRTSLGRRLATAEDRDQIVYWLRKLVFRSAWIDQRLKADLLDVDFDEERGRFRFRSDGYDVPPSLDGDVPSFSPARR